ncbi:MAG: helix-hairpin-helix domain-containing protein [Acidobacteria bacterium]|nr:helix-hairpin-helix domain-containing protein [Acidobacteriota bacterium]
MVRSLWIRSAAALAIGVVVLGAPGSLASAASSAPAGAAVKDKVDPVDVNSASAPDLEKVPGIGPSLSKRIVEFRDKNGPYATVDDLLKVQGIGEKSLSHLREYLTAAKPQKK